MVCLLEDNDGAVRLEGLLDLLRVFLGDSLFEYLWHRLDKLFCLDPTVLSKGKGKINLRMTDLDEGEVGHDRFDLFDDFWLGAHSERFKLHIEDRLFFRFRGYFFFARPHIVCACACSGSWKCSACCGEGDFLDVQTRLYGCGVYVRNKEELEDCFFF
jgi:hypothetical protein